MLAGSSNRSKSEIGGFKSARRFLCIACINKKASTLLADFQNQAIGLPGWRLDLAGDWT
ncbi:MAG: hypothetical protein WCA64_04855 [Gallionella sp.]